jgi:O-antigen biosynthesis protein
LIVLYLIQQNMPDLPVILVFAPRPLHLESPPLHNAGQIRELDCRHYLSDENLNTILAAERPDAIVSFGDRGAFPHLSAAPFEVRRRWLHFESAVSSAAELEGIGAMAFGLFMQRALDNSAGSSEFPLVSVFTPAFRTSERHLRRAYRSLLDQTYDNWEWVIMDDSADGGATLRKLEATAGNDYRVKIYASHRRSGKIGAVKRQACALTRGEILVELDHDDELVSDILSGIVEAFRQNPQAGFVYSDWAEVDDDSGASLRYADGWAFGCGSYRPENYNGRELFVVNAPPVNAQTIRHIVGVPNHARAWRRDVYWQIGGHNPDLHIADDYELLVRTFLQTEMLRLPKLGYIQYLNTGSNTQDRRRSEIQRMVGCVSAYYEQQIQERLENLKALEDAYE